LTFVSLSDHIRLYKGEIWQIFVSEASIHSISFIMYFSYFYYYSFYFKKARGLFIFIFSPLCHLFIATLQLGLLDCHNSTRKCWNKLVFLIMRFVIPIIHQVLKISRLFCQDQDQDFFFKTKTKTIFHVLEAPRDQDQGLETTSQLKTNLFHKSFPP